MSNNLSNCGCGTQSTQEVCGDFNPLTATPDLGICSPYRTKRDCDAPVRPGNPCDDVNAYAVFDPSKTPPFTIIATIFDENCLPIQDENGAPILGQY